jgi:hypothetical protein
MSKHSPRLTRKAVSVAAALVLVGAVTGNAYAATKSSTQDRSTLPRQAVTKQIQLASGSPTTTLFNVAGVARVEVTCTADQSSTGAISNGLNVAVVNTGKVALPLVFFRATERPQPQFARPSGVTVTPGGAATELFSLDDGIDNAHTLQVTTVANRRMTLDLAALTKHTPTGGCLVNATLTTA